MWTLILFYSECCVESEAVAAWAAAVVYLASLGKRHLIDLRAAVLRGSDRVCSTPMRTHGQAGTEVFV